ncbi:MAG: hypothetical protein IPJ58_05840 [Ardenticatenia bacterium]|nr:hypothetical protein [Ardenticatenia bacterium]
MLWLGTGLAAEDEGIGVYRLQGAQEAAQVARIGEVPGRDHQGVWPWRQIGETALPPGDDRPDAGWTIALRQGGEGGGRQFQDRRPVSRGAERGQSFGHRRAAAELWRHQHLLHRRGGIERAEHQTRPLHIEAALAAALRC